jgi:hypothetical protein
MPVEQGSRQLTTTTREQALALSANKTAQVAFGYAQVRPLFQKRRTAQKHQVYTDCSATQTGSLANLALHDIAQYGRLQESLRDGNPQTEGALCC